MSAWPVGRRMFWAMLAVAAMLVAGSAWLVLHRRPVEGFVEYAMPPGEDTPTAIAAAPDGTIWFTIDSAAVIGRIRQGKVERLPKEGRSLEPIGLAASPEGGAWLADVMGHKLVHIRPDGGQEIFPLDTPTVRIGRLAAAADGAVWFAEGTMHSITRFHQGVLTRHSIRMIDGGPYGVAIGPDGVVWATLQLGNRLLRIEPGGNVRSIELPKRGVGPSDVAVGPDGTVWILTFRGNSILRYKDGQFTETVLDGENAGLSGLAVAANGDVWFGMARNGSLGRLRNGEVTTHRLPRERARPYTLTIDPTGNVWYADIAGFVGMLPVATARR